MQYHKICLSQNTFVSDSSEGHEFELTTKVADAVLDSLININWQQQHKVIILAHYPRLMQICVIN